MVIGCWAVKGGVGTTVVSCALAMSGHPSTPALVVDLAGDAPACLGVAEPTGAGLAEWLAAGPNVPPDGLARLESPVRPGLSLLHRGEVPLTEERAGLLVQLLSASDRLVVIDCGRIDLCPVGREVAATVDRSILVSRLCFLAARRAAMAPVRPSGIVIVREPGRTLSAIDLAGAIGAPILADVAVDPALARSVDAGLAFARPPRRFGAALAALAAAA